MICASNSIFHIYKQHQRSEPWSYIYKPLCKPLNSRIRSSKYQKMRTHIIIFCVFVTLIYFFFSNIAIHSSPVTSSSSFIHQEKRAQGRALKTFSNQRHETVSAKSSTNKKYDRSKPLKSSGDGDDGDELIYHIDYHGVMTHHPAPTPKHPQP